MILIPKLTRREIDDYVKNRKKPNPFINAVLCGHLYDAFEFAKHEDILAMPDIVHYVARRIPLKCRGSRYKVEAWLKNDDNKTTSDYFI